MKYVVFYGPAEDMEAARARFPAHRAWYEEFARRGDLLMIGPFAGRDGAMAVFTSRKAAEEFIAGDPFVLNEVVRKWSIREWNEALGP